MSEGDGAVRVTRADLEWWLAVADDPRLPWRVAKTMPEYPHSYIHLSRTEQVFTKEDYARAFRVIHTFGEPGKFYGKTKIYLTSPDGLTRWWVADPTPEVCDLVNRASTAVDYGPQTAPRTQPAVPPGPTGEFYDQIAASYDDLWTDADDLAENAAVRDHLIRQFGAYAPTTLDVGCGTGLLFDMGLTSPKLYTGIDPSRAMLNRFCQKHRQLDLDLRAGTASQHLPQLRQAGARYDLVAALFASASYLTDADREDAVALGRVTVMMTYLPNWVPAYYATAEERSAALAQAAQAHAHVLRLATAHGGSSFELGHFLVTTIRAADAPRGWLDRPNPATAAVADSYKDATETTPKPPLT